jgi:hypothetical protein
MLGVDNTSVDNSRLYTQPEDIWDVYRELSEVSPYFSIAAGFGNVHGVYKPGNVKLQPILLKKHQEYTKAKINAKEDKPMYNLTLTALTLASWFSMEVVEVLKKNTRRLSLTVSSRSISIRISNMPIVPVSEIT